MAPMQARVRNRLFLYPSRTAQILRFRRWYLCVGKKGKIDRWDLEISPLDCILTVDCSLGKLKQSSWGADRAPEIELRQWRSRFHINEGGGKRLLWSEASSSSSGDGNLRTLALFFSLYLCWCCRSRSPRMASEACRLVLGCGWIRATPLATRFSIFMPSRSLAVSCKMRQKHFRFVPAFPPSVFHSLSDSDVDEKGRIMWI